jgi:S-disulfanyl-L-cysteine oxidoreductase SoxD
VKNGLPLSECKYLLVVLSVVSAGGALAARGELLVNRSAERPASSQVEKKTIWDAIYTRQQARRGELAYRETCGYCHGLDFGGSEVGGELAPELLGAIFLLRWDGPLSQLFVKIDEDMPKDSPGAVTPQAAIDIISYLLEANGAQAGEMELQPDRGKLSQILVTRKPPKG